MKKTLWISALVAALVCSSAFGQVRKDLSRREVSDARLLQNVLNYNFGYLESVIADIDAAAATIRHFEIEGDTSEDARIDITVNAGASAGNKHRMLVDNAGNAMVYQTDADEAGVYATRLTLAKDGKLTMKGGAVLDNTTSATELNITETAVKITGNLTSTGNARSEGTTTSVGDFDVNTNKFKVTAASGNTAIAGTLAVVGNSTFSGTLGVTGNTSVSNVTAAGTLAVTGVATFTAAPKVTAVTTAGTNTATMANAPDVEDAAAPVWITITIGADDYVIPAFKLAGE